MLYSCVFCNSDGCRGGSGGGAAVLAITGNIVDRETAIDCGGLDPSSKVARHLRWHINGTFDGMFGGMFHGRVTRSR